MRFFLFVFLMLATLTQSWSSERGGGGGGGGSGAGNGGNGGDGFLQTLTREKIAGVFIHSENEKLLTKDQREKILKAIEEGIPFIAVVPESLEEEAFSLPDVDETALVSKATKTERARLLDNGKNKVDARVVRDLRIRKKLIVQWDEISLKEATRSFTKVRHEFFRDILHEVLRFAFFKGIIPTNDDDRKLSGKFYLPDDLETLTLKSVGYRMDVKRRAGEILAMEREVQQMITTDAAPHALTDKSMKVHQHNVELLSEIHSNPRIQLTEPLEEVAEEFDRLELNLLQTRQRILVQLNWGYRPILVENPKDRKDFVKRAAYLHQVADRIISTIHWQKMLRDSRWGKEWTDRYSNHVGPLFRDYERKDWPGDDEAAQKRFDEFESELVGRLEALHKAYPARQ